MKKHKRTTFFIDKRLQTKYILLTILLLIIYTLLFAIILFTPHILELTSQDTLDKQAEAARMLLTLHKSVWPALGAVIVILSAVTIFVSHKIAGPIYRIKKDLAERCNGNLDITIRLRKRDDLQDLAASLNTVVAELRACVHTLQGVRAGASECITEIETQIKENRIDGEIGKGIVETLQKSREQTAKAIEKYSS